MEREVKKVQKLSLNRREKRTPPQGKDVGYFFLFLCLTYETQVGLHVEWKTPAFKEKQAVSRRVRETDTLILQ